MIIADDKMFSQVDKRGSIMKTLLILIILVLFLVSCTYVSERENLKNCNFELANVRMSNVTLSGIALSFDVDVENINTGKVVLERFDYTAYANKEKLIEGSSPQKVEFNAGEKKKVTISGAIDFKSLRSGVREVLTKGKDVSYQLLGTVYLSTVFGEIPFGFKVHKKM
jgi:LEA14-like dessication related protein